MVSAVQILPAGAAEAGCAATFAIIDSYSDSSGWSNTYRFTASAATGWNFDHWEVTIDRVEEGPGGETGIYTYNTRANPVEEFESWSDWSHIRDYGIWSWTITNVVAVFTGGTVHTGLILCSATNGEILHGAGANILHDT